VKCTCRRNQFRTLPGKREKPTSTTRTI
jgi:hypothetical protein